MRKLHFAIQINAPREKIWGVLWEDATFRDWTSVFSEGSYAVSDWKEGSAIRFLDPSNSGMSSVIEKSIPNEFMSFRHVTEIKDGKEQPPKAWSGARENYTLKEAGGVTTLTVDLDTMEEYETMFKEKFPEALERVKTLSEA